MLRISLIAAIDANNALGSNNQLLCHLPADLHHFKAITMGKPIAMGRKTFLSIGKPLPGRMNIVLSRTVSSIEGVYVFASLEQAIDYIGETPELIVIGGAEVFAEVIQQAHRLYMTHIAHQFAEADAFFPEIDRSIWNCQVREFKQRDEKNKYDMVFCTYERKVDTEYLRQSLKRKHSKKMEESD